MWRHALPRGGALWRVPSASCSRLVSVRPSAAECQRRPVSVRPSAAECQRRLLQRLKPLRLGQRRTRPAARRRGSMTRQNAGDACGGSRRGLTADAAREAACGSHNSGWDRDRMLVVIGRLLTMSCSPDLRSSAASHCSCSGVILRIKRSLSTCSVFTNYFQLSFKLYYAVYFRKVISFG